MFNRYKQILLYITLPLFSGVLTFILVNKPDLSILNNKDFSLSIGSDINDGGSSEVELLDIDAELFSYKFTLGDKFKYPYIFFKVESSESHYIDFSGYDKVRINISSTGSDYININFYRFIESYTNLNTFSTYLPYIFKFKVKSEQDNYIVNKDDTSTPGWWFMENNFDAGDIPSKELKDIIYFEISNSDNTPLNEEHIVSIRDITFIQNKSTAVISGIIAVITCYVLLVLLFLVIKKVPGQSGIPMDLTLNNNKVSKVEKYIYDNYQDPLLNMTKISDELNMSIKSVSEEINRKHNISFPTFLNLIRVEEARKLLSETDMKILDIAISIGYNSPGHFNRIFKKMENCTPREFRKK